MKREPGAWRHNWAYTQINLTPLFVWMHNLVLTLWEEHDRAISQVVSRCIPLRWPRFAAKSGKVGFVVDKVALGQVFSEYFLVSPVNLHSTKFSILTITRGRYNWPEVANVPSGPSLDSTPHHAKYIFYETNRLWVFKSKALKRIFGK
jgi:hypothetical protein